MRILVIDHNAADPFCQSLYRALCREDDVALRLVVPARWFDNYRVLRTEAVRDGERFQVDPLRTVFQSRAHRLVYRGLAKVIREFNPAIVYVNAEPENFQTLECALAVRNSPGVRFVFSTWRNIDYAGGRFPYRFSALHARAEQTVLGRADHAIAFVPEAAPIFSRAGFRRVSWIPPDVDTSLFTPSNVAKAGRRDAFTVGYAGRFHPLKGLETLFHAVAGLPAGYRLLLVGGGPEEAALRRRSIEIGIGNRLEWRGPVERRRMPEVMNEMDALVLPSRTGKQWKEQFGRVLVEAMACGVPVIGSDSGGIPGVIGDAGLVFPEGDVQGLRVAIERMGDDTVLRQGYIEKGLSRVGEQYSVAGIATRYSKLFRSLLE